MFDTIYSSEATSHIPDIFGVAKSLPLDPLSQAIGFAHTHLELESVGLMAYFESLLEEYAESTVSAPTMGMLLLSRAKNYGLEKGVVSSCIAGILLVAIKMNKKDWVKALLGNSITSDWTKFLFSLAIVTPDTDGLYCFIKQNCGYNVEPFLQLKGNYGVNPVRLASFHGHTKILGLMLPSVKPELVDQLSFGPGHHNYQTSALQQALIKTQDPSVALLLEKRAEGLGSSIFISFDEAMENTKQYFLGFNCFFDFPSKEQRVNYLELLFANMTYIDLIKAKKELFSEGRAEKWFIARFNSHGKPTLGSRTIRSILWREINWRHCVAEFFYLTAPSLQFPLDGSFSAMLSLVRPVPSTIIFEGETGGIAYLPDLTSYCLSPPADSKSARSVAGAGLSMFRRPRPKPSSVPNRGAREIEMQTFGSNQPSTVSDSKSKKAGIRCSDSKALSARRAAEVLLEATRGLVFSEAQERSIAKKETLARNVDPVNKSSSQNHSRCLVQ